MTKRLAILGAGGHGRVVASAAIAAGWEEIGFFDPVFKEGQTHSGEWPIIGSGDGIRDVKAWSNNALVAIGRTTRQLELVERLIAIGVDCPVVIHPRAWVCPTAKIGPASVCLALSVVNTGATVGRGVIINTGAIVEHDCVIGDGAHISPGATLSGGVTLGARSHFGAGACARPNVTIGADVMIGAGAAVVSDLPDGVTAVGVPAKPRV